MHVTEDLLLFDYVPPAEEAGYASGGFLANALVDGNMQTGSQQQFLTRNAEVENGIPQGVWNMVFVGVKGSPQAHCGNNNGTQPNVVVDSTPSTLAEKPFVTTDDQGLFYLTVPAVAPEGRVGTDWNSDGSTNSDDQKIPFSQVYVADNETDSAASINAKLSEGLHVVLSPGIYQLDAALQLETEGQVLLGLGFATLVSANGNAAIQIGDVSGVRIAGILLQAGPAETDALLVVGTTDYQGSQGTYKDGRTHFPGDSSNPVVLSDVFARVGGPDNEPVQAKVMIVVNAGNVVGDNLWLWRADHTATGGVYNGSNPCSSGLHVFGDDVTMYGLAVEHTLEDLVLWEGDGGGTYFYQSELPYDADQQQFGDKGFAGYRVGENVTSHEAHGLGVYHFFRDYHVTVESGIVAPAAAKIVSPLSVYLNGNGVMKHVVNEIGDETSEASGNQVEYVCN